MVHPRVHAPRRPHRSIAIAAVACAACGFASAAAAQSKAIQPRSSSDKVVLYRWVDEKGVVHYGDSVPPQYADQEKAVLNRQGVQVGTIEGRKTPEQIAADNARRAAEEKVQADITNARQRDQHLLATYLTVEEIESLRDQRIDILDAQGREIQAYLDQLRVRSGQLEAQARQFKPYNTADKAPALPERLAEDLVRSQSDIHNQERILDMKRQETARVRAQFTSDIARFRELKRAEAEYAKSAPAR